MKQQSKTRIWKDVVLDALIQLGGEAHVNQITEIAKQDPKATTNQHIGKKVQQVVRAYSVFETVQEGSGIYRVVETAPLPLPVVPLPAPAVLVPPAAPYSVTDEVQGMLLAAGKIYGYGVYAPANDRTMRKFNGQPLSTLTDISTNLSAIVGSSKSAVVERIDVIWFDEDEMGVFPAIGFEVEHTTKIVTGFNRLAEIPQRFKSKLFIIGDDEKDKDLFDKLLKQNVYKPFKSRFVFQTFDDVRNLYQSATAFENAKRGNEKAMQSFGVVEA